MYGKGKINTFIKKSYSTEVDVQSITWTIDIQSSYSNLLWLLLRHHRGVGINFRRGVSTKFRSRDPVYYAGIISGIIGSEKHKGICWNNRTIPRNNWCNVIRPLFGEVMFSSEISKYGMRAGGSLPLPIIWKYTIS